MKKYLPILGMFLLFLVACSPVEESSEVTVQGRKILVEGSPYRIKGVCYHPVPKGQTQRSFARLDEDLKLMREAGINTVRLYAPVDDRGVLDRIQEAGIKVIVGFGYNQDGFYDILSGTFADYIRKYKNHPAILFWELGNEYNYHPEWFDGDMKNWYAALNEAATVIHQLDSRHPVATAHGELPDSLALASCPEIDIWGMNVYRWDDPSGIFAQWEALSGKPMYLSEAGADSYMTIARDGYQQGVNERAQADALKKILTQTFGNARIGSGVTVFSFTDGWWKAGNPEQQDPGGWAPNSSGVPYDGAPNEEYWGIVDINRNKKQAFDVVKKVFTQQTIVLCNEKMEVQIDAPLENYNFSRFDWTGKIRLVKFKGIPLAGIERSDRDENLIGKGFYNEFGIDAPLAYDETEVGGWFHKIGIGALKRDGEPYFFMKKYEVRPARFEVNAGDQRVLIRCISEKLNGRSYELTKEITLLDDGFRIHYRLKNTGEKEIATNEYCHNFVAVNNDSIGPAYVLTFPFNLTLGAGEVVNPEELVTVGAREVTFQGTPSEQFFYSNLNGGQSVEAAWELVNLKAKIGIREHGDFETARVNLWGWGHVISPELFFDVKVAPGEVVEWTRTFSVFEIQ